MLGKESEEDTGSYGRTDDTADIRTHGVHEQIV